MSDDINIEINGMPLQVAPGTMVIQAADEAGITIPRFCYHKKLSVAANCRMCLVEVEKAPKPLPACATPVTEGMKVFTKSEFALEAQKSVMEFLLINHPLDCPICDQGGECDLQDIAMGYGKDVSRFAEKKRVVPSKNIGPLIATDMTRCIHCTRCVRFGQEIGGIMELGAYGRGEDVRIGTYMESAVSSEMSGNVIDLCPVGALTSKPYRYRGRPWENQQRDSIAAHDCVGSNLEVEVCRNTVMRVLPRENEAINETWLSDRDRFSYTGLYHEQRTRHALIKQGDQWRQVDWQIALNYAVEGIKTVQQGSGSEQIGALTSPSATLEEMYLLQKLLRSLGSHNIDYRLRQLDFSQSDIASRYPSLGCTIAELEQIEAGLLIGSCVRKDQPIIAHRLRKAALNGANIMSVNAIDYDVNFPLAESIVTAPANMPQTLAGIARALLTLSGESAPADLGAKLENITSHDDHLAIAKHLYSADNALVLLGTQAMGQIEFGELQNLAELIGRLAGAKFGYLTEGANSAGAWLAGAVPHRQAGGETLASPGRHAGEMLSQPQGAMLLLNVEPEFDSAYGSQAFKAMQESDFVVTLSPYVSDSLKACADVILPITPFIEMSGTFINVEGNWQSFSAAVDPVEEAKPAWKVLRVLGNLFEFDGFDQVTSEEVRDELRGISGQPPMDNQSAWQCPQLAPSGSGLQRIGHLPIYAVDSLVRRAQPLQDSVDAIAAAAYMNEQTANEAGVSDGAYVLVRQDNSEVRLPLVIDEAVPAQCVLIPYGVAGSETLTRAYGPIELQRG
ncbi:NADH-quinone oxidoreductase subunit NuoG [Thiohalophilus sp.]|uniref:NADH-quinone oxidoreductase subunit NuoG n=1 Tax=Thiohalophilus sp. TaxID=3028392 RepID=UPI002ACD84C4|nr:NADH-quinone oxidoreductase subunit NuoG [Thiohalophilus sp.]MDZ7662579.1 NADH-quinone oxidoreductase subunit NuoG [Thiohalophilus sp.]